MEGIKNNPHVRVIGTFDQIPSVMVIGNMAPPRQGFIPQHDLFALGKLSQSVEITGTLTAVS